MISRIKIKMNLWIKCSMLRINKMNWRERERERERERYKSSWLHDCGSSWLSGREFKGNGEDPSTYWEG